LTTAAGLAGGTVPNGATLIGIVTSAPTGSNVIMKFELRI